MAKYSVLTFIFDNYEVLREVQEIDEDAEYICVTDSDTLSSSTWTIIRETSFEGKTPFEKCWNVRYNCFKYCTTDICIRVDGSIQINKSLKPIIDDFEDGEFDACLMVHPYRNNFINEYNEWIKSRHYSLQQAKRCISFMDSLGYNLLYKGMFQLCFSIQRRCDTTNHIDKLIMLFLRSLEDERGIERLDQTIFSFVINTYFSNMKIMPIGQDIFEGSLMSWYGHNSWNKVPYIKKDVIAPYMFNKPVALYHYE